jgi:hypothetical protein
MSADRHICRSREKAWHTHALSFSSFSSFSYFFSFFSFFFFFCWQG